jgi:hypothetical protein
LGAYGALRGTWVLWFEVQKNPTLVTFPVKNLDLKEALPVPAGRGRGLRRLSWRRWKGEGGETPACGLSGTLLASIFALASSLCMCVFWGGGAVQSPSLSRTWT